MSDYFEYHADNFVVDDGAEHQRGSVREWQIADALKEVNRKPPTEQERLVLGRLGAHGGASWNAERWNAESRSFGGHYIDYDRVMRRLLSKRRVMRFGGVWVVVGMTEAQVDALLVILGNAREEAIAEAWHFIAPVRSADPAVPRQPGLQDIVAAFSPALELMASGAVPEGKNGPFVTLPVVAEQAETVAHLANRASRHLERAMNYHRLAVYIGGPYRSMFQVLGGDK